MNSDREVAILIYRWGATLCLSLITVTVAGPMAGAVSTVAGVGDGDIITIIIILEVAGILVAVDTGEATIGGVVIHIRTGATAEHVVRQLHGVLTELVE